MDPYHKGPIRTSLYYNGGRNLPLEEKLRLAVEKANGLKAGEWGYAERGFSCLFLFKKESHFDSFKNNLRITLGIDFNRVLIGTS